VLFRSDYFSSTKHNIQDNIMMSAKRSVGEELFLVHLNRQLQEENDTKETTPPRERSVSIGEELFGVHLKRAKGMEPDSELLAGKATDGVSGHVIHLRSRDVPPNKRASPNHRQ